MNSEPKLLGMLQAHDREFTTQTVCQLSHAFFLGFSTERMIITVERLGHLKRTPELTGIQQMEGTL